MRRRSAATPIFRRDNVQRGRRTFGDATFDGDPDFEGGDLQRHANFGGATFKRRGSNSLGQRSATRLCSMRRHSAAAPISPGRPSTATPISTGRCSAAPGQFARTTFDGDADFSWATFNDYAGFRDATFCVGAGFDDATFKRLRGVRPRQVRGSSPVRPPTGPPGAGAGRREFVQPVQIEVSTTGVCCRQARFPGGAQFQFGGPGCAGRHRLFRPVDPGRDPTPVQRRGLGLQEDRSSAWQRLPAGESPSGRNSVADAGQRGRARAQQCYGGRLPVRQRA